MAISVTLKQNKFGRPYKAYPHHYIGLGVTITGGSGSYQMRFKPYDDISTWTSTDPTWFDLPTSSSITNNKDGFITSLNFWHGTYDFQFRDKNNQSDVVSITDYELFYDNQLTGLPMGDTPIIVNSNINAGLSSSINIKTAKPNSLVRIYRSRANSNNIQEFFPTDEPFRTGISNGTGDFSISLPITQSGVKVCATAQSVDDFESLSSNYIEINGPKKKQLLATFTYGTATGTGRKITVTGVSGGSGAYSIGTANNGDFPYSLNQEFEIPFGKSNLFIRDNNAEAQVEWHVSVVVDGGSSSQTFYNHDIRSNFNASVNSGAVRYGKLVGSTFTAANDYGNHDGRTSWGFSGTSFPAIGIQENQNFTLPPDRLLFHPNIGEHACIRYITQAAGTFSISGNSMRVGRIDNPWAGTTNLTTKFKILHNGVVKHSYTHTTEGGNQNFSLNFAVASGDNIDLVVECGDENDLGFDHVHVKATMSLATAGGSVTTPTAPTISGASPVQTGAALAGTGNQAGDYVVMYRDGYPESLAITTSTTFAHGAMYDGAWTAKIARNKVLSAASNVITTNSNGNTAPPAPVITSSGATIGSNIFGTTVQSGTILIYKNGVQITDSVTTTSNGLSFSWSYMPTDVGNYTFVLSNTSGISVASEIVSVARRRKFKVKDGIFCTVPTNNIQVGSGDSAAAVTNWTDGLTVEHNGNLTANSKLYIRDKNSPSNVSESFAILSNL
jgi:hypothetical protein